MNARQQINFIVSESNRKEDRQISREKFAEGLVMDLKQYGKAEYHVNGKKEVLVMGQVVEHMDSDIDDPIERFFMSPGDEVAIIRLHNAINEAALGLANLLAEQVVK